MCSRLPMYQQSFQVPTDLSDIWGWVDSQEMNMPLLANEDASIFSLANPSQPGSIFRQGMNSIWRYQNIW